MENLEQTSQPREQFENRFKGELAKRLENSDKFLHVTRDDRSRPVRTENDALLSYMHKRVQAAEHVLTEMEEEGDVDEGTLEVGRGFVEQMKDEQRKVEQFVSEQEDRNVSFEDGDYVGETPLTSDDRELIAGLQEKAGGAWEVAKKLQEEANRREVVV